MRDHDVVVVGSANVDTVLTVSTFPRPGETITALTSRQTAGGKGLNQAVAAARAGAGVAFRGRVGEDGAGTLVRTALTAADVDTEGLLGTADPTGSAHILVDAEGENSITLVDGANGSFSALTADDERAIMDSRVVLLQGEIPVSALAAAMRVARTADTIVVFTPAPARHYPGDLLRMVDVLVPNEHEARVLAGRDDVAAAARELAASSSAVLVTLGGRGALLLQGGDLTTIAPIATTVVDTVGAGDTFVGALGARLAAGDDLRTAAAWATAAGSLAVGRAAGQPAPTHDEIKSLFLAQPD